MILQLEIKIINLGYLFCESASNGVSLQKLAKTQIVFFVFISLTLIKSIARLFRNRYDRRRGEIVRETRVSDRHRSSRSFPAGRRGRSRSSSHRVRRSSYRCGYITGYSVTGRSSPGYQSQRSLLPSHALSVRFRGSRFLSASVARWRR